MKSAQHAPAVHVQDVGDFGHTEVAAKKPKSSSRTLETVASGLTLPTAMTFGPAGVLYVTNQGFGTPPGAGQIVRINVPPATP